jgi:DUF1680 family protein
MGDPLSRRRFLVFSAASLAAPSPGSAAARPGAAGTPQGAAGAPRTPLRAADYRRVRFADPFWAPRQRTNRETTVPHLFRKLREVGAIDNLRRAGTGLSGGHRGYVFADSDVHKTLEAASYCLGVAPEPAIARETDALIALVREAQAPDGYLDSAYQLGPKPRFSNLRDDHELYCAGHLVEAGVAHFEATGRRELLDVAIRAVDLVERTFGDGPGRRAGYPGHPELELALVRLFRLTGDERYLRLARHFLDHRGEHFFAREHGTPESGYDGRYWLDDVGVREQPRISGHAVRALYLFAGALDVAAITADAALRAAVDRIWTSAVERRMFVTGGLGSSARNEGFSDDYDLPTFGAYQETCASIAFVMLNQRLALLTGDARYADLVEWSLYNAVAAGISLSGDRFFYVNPLASHGAHHRQPWYDCACCPPNVARTLASLGQYAYATAARDLYVNLYAAARAELDVGDGHVRLELVSDYPWDGRVALTLLETSAGPFSLRLRRPGWCPDDVAVRVNGEAVPDAGLERGYLVLRRAWRAGDRVELELPLPVRRLAAHPLVAEAAGRVALCRGPIVYCVEQVDLGAALPALRLPSSAELRPERGERLGGAAVLRGEALAIAATAAGPLYAPLAPLRREVVGFTAVPYCVWDNRSAGAMQVWIASA